MEKYAHFITDHAAHIHNPNLILNTCTELNMKENFKKIKLVFYILYLQIIIAIHNFIEFHYL